MSARRDLLIYRNYSTVVAKFVCTSTTGDSCSLHAFCPHEKLHTKEWRMHPVLLVPPVSMESVPLLPNSLRIWDNGLYCDPGLFILYTTLLGTPLAKASYLASNSASLSIGFVVAHGFVGLPITDPISVFRVTSSPFPMPLLGLRASVVIVLSSGVVSKIPQTTRGAVHSSVSY